MIELSVTGQELPGIVDQTDADLSLVSWTSYNRGGYLYLSGWRRGEKLLLHREIMSRIVGRPLDPRELVDHKNGNTFDNRRDNLRIATAQQNQANQKLRRDNTSGFKGVRYRKPDSHHKGKWIAEIKVHGKKMYLGRFPGPEEAARAYDAAAIYHFGEFAKLNFPAP